jgi:hypothetical protein
MGDDPESPSSRCTSPDLHGYTTAGEEQVAEDTSDCSSNSSNRTVRDPSPPRLRPRAHTVPKFICTVNVDFLRIEYMVLAKYQHMSILELILLVKQHILILCKNLLGVDVLIIVN